MASWTNRGIFLLFDVFFHSASPPGSFYLTLVTADTTPTVDTNTLGQLTEIAAGNGYTAGGIQINRDNVDWSTLTEDDTADQVLAELIDKSWTAAGGALPATGNGARYAVLTTNEATVGDRQVIMYHDLGSARQVTDGQTLSVLNLEVTGGHAP